MEVTFIGKGNRTHAFIFGGLHELIHLGEGPQEGVVAMGMEVDELGHYGQYNSVMKFVLGVDEAGRGPLAGPVAVGVVMAPEGFDFLTTFPGLNDSKKLSEKRREKLFELLVEQVQAGTVQVAVILKSAKEIDGRGIAVVIRNAVAEGIRKLAPTPNAKVWLDGSLKAPEEYEQETVIGGDATIPAIMLASIAAKVSRDRHMVRLAEKYPAYDFAKHKGYGTAAHIQVIREQGLSDLHRRSFCKNFL